MAAIIVNYSKTKQKIITIWIRQDKSIDCNTAENEKIPKTKNKK